MCVNSDIKMFHGKKIWMNDNWIAFLYLKIDCNNLIIALKFGILNRLIGLNIHLYDSLYKKNSQMWHPRNTAPILLSWNVALEKTQIEHPRTFHLRCHHHNHVAPPQPHCCHHIHVPPQLEVVTKAYHQEVVEEGLTNGAPDEDAVSPKEVSFKYFKYFLSLQ